ncbi:MAG TPA: hypothetical protein VGL42_12880 [Opitutaceae bacterium]
MTEIERAVAADEPSPLGGSWDNSRTVNYHEGLARLTFASRLGSKAEPIGAVLLQSFVLADGSRCLKAHMSWKEGTPATTHSVYETPEIDWSGHARTIASTWLNEFATQQEAAMEGSLLATG